MLKTTADNPARFGTLSKGLICYAVLSEYVHHPLTFLVGTALTLPGFKKTVPEDVPREFVELFAFPAWIYLRLKQRLDPDKALALARAIILPLGTAAYGAEFGVVEAPRTWTNFMVFLDRSFQRGAIRWSKVEGEERTDTTRSYRCVSCMIHVFLSKVGIPELTESFCSLDNALYNSYMPNQMTFDRGGPANTIAKGNPFCQFNHAVQVTP
ncbi:MAG: L-2-amino-thiazoline-4-carboxylic acid hydrolase [Deltaproteobacteria bacterium]|nr:L-2-amino-thiazoline-4-carboxylic acid hydrolase [Deltaproteobacteria bacterium]